MSQLTLGIDIGGTNTAFGLVDKEGKIHFKGNVRTRDYDTAEHLAKAIYQAVSTTPGFSALKAIGIGAPNGNFHNGTIEFAPNLQWKGVIPLVEIFEKLFELPTTLTNDANAAAMGETQFGAAKGMKNFLVVTLGTGVGSGFVCNGELIYGHTGMAGELGHVVVEPIGRICSCGRHGCLETYASATGFKRTVAELGKNKSATGPLKGISTDRISALSVAELAHTGDALALEAFDTTAHYLARGLATATAITSPEVIILAGGLARSGSLLTEPLQKHLNNELLSIFRNKVKVLVSPLLEQNAAILGATALAYQN